VKSFKTEAGIRLFLELCSITVSAFDKSRMQSDKDELAIEESAKSNSRAFSCAGKSVEMIRSCKQMHLFTIYQRLFSSSVDKSPQAA
jgi:hypothetical protein